MGGSGSGGFALRTAISGVIGGTASEISGGKFANGAVSGAFVHMFNAEGDVLINALDISSKIIGGIAAVTSLIPHPVTKVASRMLAVGSVGLTSAKHYCQAKYNQLKIDEVVIDYAVPIAFRKTSEATNFIFSEGISTSVDYLEGNSR